MTALYIILGIIALIVILCSVKVKITAEYGEAFSLDVKWLFVKAHIPADGGAKGKEGSQKGEKGREEEKKKAQEREAEERGEALRAEVEYLQGLL